MSLEACDAARSVASGPPARALAGRRSALPRVGAERNHPAGSHQLPLHRHGAAANRRMRVPYAWRAR